MGFFDNYDDEAADGLFVTKDEKAAIIANGTSFSVNSVAFEKGKGYNGADRYLLGITLEGEDKLLSFSAGSVGSRDRMLGAMAEFLESGGEAPVVRIEELPAKGGNNPPQVIVPA